MAPPRITEQEVFNAIPKGGFLEKYLDAGKRTSDAHVGQHALCGLALLSLQVHPDNYYPFSGKLHANIFSLMVAPTADRKTTAIKFMWRHLTEAGHARFIAREPGSEEDLVDSVIAQPQQILAIGEFGNFLKQTKMGYRESIKTRLNDLADGSRISRSGVGKKKRGETLHCDDPRVTFISGAAPTFLTNDTTPTDWDGGFFSRFFILYTERGRTDYLPNCDLQHEVITESVALLKDRLESAFSPNAANDPLLGLDGTSKPVSAVGPCRGLSDDAARCYVPWAEAITARQQQMPSGVRSALLARVPVHVLRIAYLFAIDVAAPRDGTPWCVPLHCVTKAIEFVALHVRSCDYVADLVMPTPYALLRDAVLKAIEPAPTRLGDILVRVKLNKKLVLEIIDALVTEGLVKRSEKQQGDSNDYFHRTNAVIESEGAAQRVVTPQAPTPPADTTFRTTSTNTVLAAVPPPPPAPAVPANAPGYAVDPLTLVDADSSDPLLAIPGDGTNPFGSA